MAITPHGLVEAGLTKLELGDAAAAGDLFGRAAQLFSDVQKERITPARADLLVGMARVQLQRQELTAALQSAQGADRFWREFDPENGSAGEAAFWLGRCYQALGRHADARDAFARAQRVRGRSPVRAAAAPKS